MLVELTITLGDHASNGTEHLLKFVNNELHNLLGVDACLLSLAKSTVLEIEGLPEKGSLIRYPFSFVDKRAPRGAVPTEHRFPSSTYGGGTAQKCKHKRYFAKTHCE